MNILEYAEELKGKTIKYIDVNDDDDVAILSVITDDGCILHLKFSVYGYDNSSVEFDVETNNLEIFKKLKEAIVEYNVITEDEANSLNEEIEAEKIASKASSEEWVRNRDLAELERLKSKYEGENL